MRINQENDIQTVIYVPPTTHVWDRDFGLLRARVWERSVRLAWRQRLQEIVLNVMAVVLGSVVGWVLMK
jgi:hypothetical protein